MHCYTDFSKLIALLTFSLSSLALSQQSDDPSLTIYTYVMPGLINDADGSAVGPGVDTIEMLFTQHNLNAEFIIQPFARVSESTKKDIQSCSFPVDWTASRATELEYVIPLASVQPTLYSLTPEVTMLRSLKGQYVVTLNNYASQDMLDSLEASKILVSHPAQAFPLLLNRRVDYLFMDKPMADAIMVSLGSKLSEVHQFKTSSTWLVCNKNLELPSKIELQKSLLAILQEGELETRWRDAGLHDLYLAFFGQGGVQWQILLEQTKPIYKSDSVD
ncbi:MAG: hypothetical protein Alis3KO_25250 [Aliiglaciecola sp.]